MREAPVHPDAPRCWHCLYNLSGLAPVGPCPECGKPYDVEDGAPPIGAAKLNATIDNLQQEAANSVPWFWERIKPSSRTVTTLIITIGGTGLIVMLGWLTIVALNHKLLRGGH